MQNLCTRMTIPCTQFLGLNWMRALCICEKYSTVHTTDADMMPKMYSVTTFLTFIKKSEKRGSFYPNFKVFYCRFIS